MADTIFKYPLDLSGSHPDNRVIDEGHTVGSTRNRVFAADYGPFFGNSVVVVDAVTGNELKAGDDYKLLHYYREASDVVGDAVYAAVHITNPDVGSEVLFSAQMVGGEFSYARYAICQLLETLANDDRPVYWGNLVGVPSSFDAAPHLHCGEEFYGWQYVVEANADIEAAIKEADAASWTFVKQQEDTKLDETQNFIEAVVDCFREGINLMRQASSWEIIRPALAKIDSIPDGTGYRLTLTLSPFRTFPADIDVHASTDWIVATDANFTNIVWSSLNNIDDKIEITTSRLTALGPLWLKARFKGDSYPASAYSAVKLPLLNYANESFSTSFVTSFSETGVMTTSRNTQFITTKTTAEYDVIQQNTAYLTSYDSWNGSSYEPAERLTGHVTSFATLRQRDTSWSTNRTTTYQTATGAETQTSHSTSWSTVSTRTTTAATAFQLTTSWTTATGGTTSQSTSFATSQSTLKATSITTSFATSQTTSWATAWNTSHATVAPATVRTTSMTTSWTTTHDTLVSWVTSIQTQVGLVAVTGGWDAWSIDSAYNMCVQAGLVNCRGWGTAKNNNYWYVGYRPSYATTSWTTSALMTTTHVTSATTSWNTTVAGAAYTTVYATSATTSQVTSWTTSRATAVNTAVATSWTTNRITSWNTGNSVVTSAITNSSRDTSWTTSVAATTTVTTAYNTAYGVLTNALTSWQTTRTTAAATAFSTSRDTLIDTSWSTAADVLTSAITSFNSSRSTGVNLTTSALTSWTTAATRSTSITTIVNGSAATTSWLTSIAQTTSRTTSWTTAGTQLTAVPVSRTTEWLTAGSATTSAQTTISTSYQTSLPPSWTTSVSTNRTTSRSTSQVNNWTTSYSTTTSMATLFNTTTSVMTDAGAGTMLSTSWQTLTSNTTSFNTTTSHVTSDTVNFNTSYSTTFSTEWTTLSSNTVTTTYDTSATTTYETNLKLTSVNTSATTDRTKLI